ncbi:GerAB/ArcD/ProY family transporter [Brevibacillus reuszeri]|uniref:GerAB/ArcD/ProY family transporter n=1 Tax=Brevibacillus reuszeri TaxID=54915 RepID=UPI00289ECB55|nr:endospore germination permease [Brevibacillus reuszeri]
MQGNEKITAGQMGLLMFFAIAASAVTVVPGITGKYAHNDLWLSPIWASMIGYVTVFITCRLHQLYPNQSVIQYNEVILGSFLGKLASLFLIFFYLHLTGLILRGFAEFVVGNFLNRTPISVVMISMLLVNALAVKGGVEVLGRTSQLFFLIFLLPVALMPFLLGSMKLHYLFPILEHGLKPTFLGAASPQAWFSEVFIMAFFLPFVTNQEKSMRSGMISVFGAMLMLTVINFFILFVMGRQAGDFLYPVMVAFRYISVADFFQNLDSVVMGIWIIGMYQKISVFYYATAIGASQILGLRDYRPLVLPLGILIIVMAFWSVPDQLRVSQFDTLAFPIYGPLVQTVFPLLLWIIAIWQKRGQATNTGRTALTNSGKS